MLAFGIGFLEIHWRDILDITLVAILLFNLYKLIRGSGALKIFIGSLALYLIYLVVKATEMGLLTSILGQFMEVGVIAAVILFQHEIRKFLLLLGKTTDLKDFKLSNLFKSKKLRNRSEINLTPILDAMKALGGTNTGALIVVSKDDDLKYYAETGDIIDANLSKRMLLSIFFKNSPLHDGAAIVHKGRIVAARCILPVSDNQNIPATMGLRHRAGIGLTEVNNAVVLIVSEETGQLSFVQNGNIFHNLSVMEIRKKLNEYLLGQKEVVAAEKV